jgi:glycosyltransferase involved in cell wall biosynthesis
VKQILHSPRVTRNLRPYLVHARQLVNEKRFADVLLGFMRVAARVGAARFRRLRRRLGRSGIARLTSGWERIDSKHQRLSVFGTVESKLTVLFPSPPAQLLACIVIPCFNYGRYVREAVESALAQTVSSLEIIVVDDGSTDPETRRVLDALADLPRVRIVRQPNQGLPTARNTGVLLARSEYVCCLDADDTVEPTYVEMAIAVLEADRSVGFVCSWVRLFGDEVGIWKTRDFDIDDALIENHTAAGAVFRRDDWLAVGGYRPDMRQGYEDWDFWLRIAALGRRGRVVRTPLFNHRRHGRTMTYQAHAKRRQIIGTMHDHNPLILGNARFRSRLARMSFHETGAPPFALLRQDRVLTPPDRRPHVLVLAPWLANGGAEILLLDVLDILKNDWRISIATTLADEQEAWTEFRQITTDIVPLHGAFEEELWPAVIEHVIATRATRLVLSHGSAFAYGLLPDLKVRCPGLKTVDILHTDLAGGHIRGAVSATAAIDRHVVVSGRIATALRANGVPTDRITAIRNGVDTEQLFNPARYDRVQARRQLSLPASKLVVAFVGRLAEEKRPLEFLSCIAKLMHHAPIQAIMVGDGPLGHKLETEIKRQNLSKVIVRQRHIERGEIGAVYAAADVLVLTSATEGLPFTVLEAMATGCPVIATDVGDLPTLIEHGANGFLVPADRPSELASVLRAFERASDQHASYRFAARQTIERSKLTLSAMQSKYAKLFQSLLNDPS